MHLHYMYTQGHSSDLSEIQLIDVPLSYDMEMNGVEVVVVGSTRQDHAKGVSGPTLTTGRGVPQFFFYNFAITILHAYLYYFSAARVLKVPTAQSVHSRFFAFSFP